MDGSHSPSLQLNIITDASDCRIALARLKSRHADLAPQPASLPLPSPPVSTMREVILPRIGVHELLGIGDRDWTPPLAAILHVVSADPAASPPGVVWVGRRTWTYPLVLRRAGILQSSLHVDADSAEQRLWAAELALRAGEGRHWFVIADGRALDRTATQRLHLAAQAAGTRCILARPQADVGELSAATTRWHIARDESNPHAAGWRADLLRCKGMRPVSRADNAWELVWSHETGTGPVLPVLERGSLPAPHQEHRLAG